MRAQSDRIRVMLTTHGPGRNPFIPQLVSGLESAGAEASYFSWPRALWGKVDVIHLHWVEGLFLFDTGLRKVAKRALVRLMLLRARLARIPIIQTVHNLDPHDTLVPADARLFDRIMEQVSLNIYMSDAQPDGTLIPHGHYRDWHGLDPTAPPDSGPTRAVTVGQLRKYKNIEDVVTAFTGVEDAGYELVVAGKARPEEYSRELRDLTGGRDSVVIRDEFLSDDDMVSLIQSSHLVVLPYPEIYNSGVLFLALSVGRPVLVRQGPISLALRDEFGPEWILLFEGQLTANDLRGALASVDHGGTSVSWPPMTGRDWLTIGRSHVDVYRRALRELRTR
ncbi:glycosyltransferase [Microbacterium sp. RURRCA19A]|uniref:glycosyltransferase n=1 Tax=Microbacterium sp. RURRCA19A TaxID=1907391 RepID=UPI0009556DE6|nr:glycosyltransferase [Microbacterium sp. RURRCA19A]SIR78619.1 beta-1,4-mannosyltransferase&\